MSLVFFINTAREITGEIISAAVVFISTWWPFCFQGRTEISVDGSSLPKSK